MSDAAFVTLTPAKKRIAVFLDGTWNTVNDNTNVWRLKALCAPESKDGMQQCLYYNPGVGTKYEDERRACIERVKRCHQRLDRARILGGPIVCGIRCPDGDQWWPNSRAPDRAQRPHCLAGHVRLELRNVVAKYPFERAHGFPRIQPNSGHRDYSRLSCGVRETQLGPNVGSQRRCLRGGSVDR